MAFCLNFFKRLMINWIATSWTRTRAQENRSRHPQRWGTQNCFWLYRIVEHYTVVQKNFNCCNNWVPGALLVPTGHVPTVRGVGIFIWWGFLMHRSPCLSNNHNHISPVSDFWGCTKARKKKKDPQNGGKVVIQPWAELCKTDVGLYRDREPSAEEARSSTHRLKVLPVERLTLDSFASISSARCENFRKSPLAQTLLIGLLLVISILWMPSVSLKLHVDAIEQA